MSKYTDQLIHSIASSNDIVTNLKESSRLAVHFARQTNSIESRNIIDKIRKTGSMIQIACVAARLHLAEAINLANEADLESARKSCYRSHLLSRIDNEAYAEVSAWLAHFEQLMGNRNETLTLLKRTFESVTSIDLLAIQRASITLADELHSLDQFATAKDFYHAARLCAERLGDDAAVAELLFNIASHGVENCRIFMSQNHNPRPDQGFFISHAGSAQRYCQLLGILGGKWMFYLLQMNIEALTENYEILLSHEIESQLKVIQKTRPSLYHILRVDKHLAENLSQEGYDAQDDLNRIQRSSENIHDDEELAIFYSQLGKAFRRAGDIANSLACSQRASAHFERLQSFRSEQLKSNLLQETIDAARSCLGRLRAS